MKQGVYSLAELKDLFESTQSEFKPVKGVGVDSKEKEENAKAVKEIAKETKAATDINPKPEGLNKFDNSDDANSTMLDIHTTSEAPKEYKDRVEKLVKDSTLTSDGEESATKEGNEKFYKKASENAEERADKIGKLRHSGLAARERYSDEECKPNTIVKEDTRKITRFTFKRSAFMNESDVKNHIPEDAKTDGNRFIMKDCNDKEYMVECRAESVPNTDISYIKTEVRPIATDNLMNEELERMKALSGYRSDNYFGQGSKISESEVRLKRDMDNMRNLAE